MRGLYIGLAAVAIGLAIVLGVILPPFTSPGYIEGGPTVAYAEELTKPELVARINNFTLNFYGEVLKDYAGRNLVLSPFNIYIALTLLYEGADGKTLEELGNAMMLHDVNACTAYRELLSALPISAKNDTALMIANGAWFRQDFPVWETYVNMVRNCYNAEIRYFSNPYAVVDDINSWVAEKTRGLIKKLITPDYVNDQLVAVLVSAIYFKAEWVTKFEPYGNITFHTPSGGVKAPFMEAVWETAGYCEGEGYKAVMLPYKNTSIAMVIIMPDVHTWLTTKYREMVAETLNHFKKEPVYDGSVRVVMPKFEIRFGGDNPEIIPYLRKLGIHNAFDPDRADLSRMTPADVYVGHVLHKAVIKVHENGTEAAAATAVMIYRTAAPMGDVNIVIDRPFLYMLWDRDSGAILFIGQLVNPVE